MSGAAIRTGMVLSPTAIVVGLVLHFGTRLGLVPPVVGAIGETVCFGLFLSAGGLVLFLLKQYREYDQQLLTVAQLPRRVRLTYERLTPELLQLGFEYLGDVRLTRAGMIIVRQFLSQDGQTLAFLESGLGLTAHSFLSITANGVCLETANLDNTKLENASIPKRRRAYRGSLEATYQAHQRFVFQHAQERNDPALPVDPEQVPGLIDYEHRVSAWSLYEVGLFKQPFNSPPPPIPVFESLARLQAERDQRLRQQENYGLAG